MLLWFSIAKTVQYSSAYLIFCLPNLAANHYHLSLVKVHVYTWWSCKSACKITRAYLNFHQEGIPWLISCRPLFFALKICNSAKNKSLYTVSLGCLHVTLSKQVSPPPKRVFLSRWILKLTKWGAFRECYRRQDYNIPYPTPRGKSYGAAQLSYNKSIINDAGAGHASICVRRNVQSKWLLAAGWKPFRKRIAF